MTSIDTPYNVEPTFPPLAAPDSGATTLQDAVDRSVSNTVWKTLNRIVEEARAAFGDAEVPLDLDYQGVGVLLIRGLMNDDLVSCYMDDLAGTNEKAWASQDDDLAAVRLFFFKRYGNGRTDNTEQSPEGAPEPLVIR